MFDNRDWAELQRLERLQERNVLRRKMLEQQAINSDPDTFDRWADQIDACNDELRRIGFAILKMRAVCAKHAYETEV